MSTSDARAHLAELVSQAHYGGATTFISRRGVRLAAIVPVDVADAAEHVQDAMDAATDMVELVQALSSRHARADHDGHALS